MRKREDAVEVLHKVFPGPTPEPMRIFMASLSLGQETVEKLTVFFWKSPPLRRRTLAGHFVPRKQQLIPQLSVMLKREEAV